MLGYKLINSSRGIRYMKDGRLVGASTVPENIRDQLKAGEILEEPVTKVVDKEAERRQENRFCLFCGTYTNWKRLVNKQEVPICEQHYYDTTIGKIAEKLRQVNLVN